MSFFKNHFRMVMTCILAFCLSLIMATSAIFIANLNFTIPLLVRNWGTVFLVIMITGFLCPLTQWSFALCDKLKIKPGTLAHDLIDDLVASLIFNSAATFVMAAVNIFGNAEIEAAVAAGALPSVQAVYWSTVLHDWPITFVISYIVAFFVMKIAERIAVKAAGPPAGMPAPACAGEAGE
ncbi:MAG: hypothetical protein Q4B42_07875 [Oscillospiraceae bacterium]|nr:hypothetical protein [Oscillospiraceae bacterium]